MVSNIFIYILVIFVFLVVYVFFCFWLLLICNNVCIGFLCVWYKNMCLGIIKLEVDLGGKLLEYLEDLN